MEEKRDDTGRTLRGNEINWNQVFYFSRVALHGSIKDAAQELGLTSSTISQQLNQLEEDLQVRLFQRQHRKLVLTPQGNRLFQHAKDMFEAGQRLIDVVSPLSLGGYPVCIAITPGASLEIAKQIVGSYLSRFRLPNLRVVQSRHEELEQGLAEARLDFAFSDRPASLSELTSLVLSTSRVRLFVAPRFARRSLEELVQQLPLLVCAADSSGHRILGSFCEHAGVAPKGRVFSEYPSLLYQLCEAGLGVGVFNDTLVKTLAIDLVPVAVPRGFPELTDTLYALWSKDGENSEAVRRLKTLLKGIPEGGLWEYLRDSTWLGTPGMFRV